jgi:hypothetical protein
VHPLFIILHQVFWYIPGAFFSKVAGYLSEKLYHTLTLIFGKQTTCLLSMQLEGKRLEIAKMLLNIAAPAALTRYCTGKNLLVCGWVE